MKYWKSYLITILILLFSFYYTYKSVDIVKNINPIMDKINKNSSKFERKPINATIKDNTIIPGIKGKEVDKEISYSKMKKYGKYNESLTRVKDVYPKISIKNNKDKYIISGNKIKKEVSIIFYIKDLEELEIITNYLNNENIDGTLLLNTVILENEKEIQKIKIKEIELSFNKTSDIELSEYSNYLNSITSKKNKYCITTNKNNKILNNCKRHKLYTVIPNIILEDNPSLKIKKELNNASIIYVEFNNSIRKELDYIIYYIKSKGYRIVYLDELLTE